MNTLNIVDYNSNNNGAFRTPLETIEAPTWWQKQGLQFTSTGYGSKIPTAYKVKHNNRWKRVYCSIFSNCGTLYIMSHGNRIIVDS